ncbi:MAG: 50S ribosomal protein L20 [Clostridia bacterium]|nr:50S ribosomal protein L20 [Clostridia bacterium]MBC7347890.1 50S ribosomal protein L20 [Clostridia bacterium]
MPRVKRGVTKRRRHKKILKLAKGYWGAKSKLFRVANQQVMKSLAYAYAHRRQRKGDFRRLWIARINAAARTHGLSYSRFISGLRQAGVDINRKMLADLAIRDTQAFARLVAVARESLHPGQ